MNTPSRVTADEKLSRVLLAVQRLPQNYADAGEIKGISEADVQEWTAIVLSAGRRALTYRERSRLGYLTCYYALIVFAVIAIVSSVFVTVLDYPTDTTSDETGASSKVQELGKAQAGPASGTSFAVDHSVRDLMEEVRTQTKGRENEPYTAGIDEKAKRVDAWNLAASKGDFWGGHLASGGSIAGVFLLLVTILMQREQLKAQSETIERSQRETQKALAISEAQLRVGRESATIAQVLECARLKFAEETKRPGKDWATEHLARLDPVLEAMLARDILDPDLRTAMKELVGTYEADEFRKGEA